MTATATPPDCAGASSPPQRTDAEQWEMVLGVTALVKKLITESTVRRSDRDDLIQDCLVMLHNAAGRYDNGRGLTWCNYAGAAVKKVIADYHRQRSGDGRAGCGIVLPPVDIREDKQPADTRPPDVIAVENEERARLGDGLDDWGAFAELLRESMQAPLLDGLTSATRRAVELILAGNSPDQVAGQTGRPVKDVKLALRNAATAIRRRVEPSFEAEYRAELARRREKAKETKRAKRTAVG